jgi:zinc protease
MRLLIHFIFFILTFLFQEASMAKTLNAQTKTLPNGLQIVVITNNLAPVVSVGVLYKNGCSDDPIVTYGLSHFLEHMMFKGTKDVKSFDRFVSERGASYNAYTTYDFTYYHTTISKTYLEDMIRIEADRMVNLTFTEADVISERDVVQQERLMRLDNHPFGAAMESMLRSNYWYHPYGIPPIGYAHHISAYNYENVRKHYDTYYTPSNAVLVVTGAATLDEVMPFAEKYFGPLKAKAVPPRVRPTEPDHDGITTHIEQENKRNSLIILGWYYAAPSHRLGEAKHCFPLIVLSQILGGNDTTQFYKHFVEEKKLALSISSSYDGAEVYDCARFSIWASLSPTMDVNALKAELKAYLEKLKSGISQQDVDMAKSDLMANFVFAKDGSLNSLEELSRLGVGFTLDDIENWDDKLGAVTKAQVDEAFHVVFDSMPITTLALYPKKQ